MTEVPAAPLMQELDRRRVSFSSLKAAARVRTERKGRKRVDESVAFLHRTRQSSASKDTGPWGNRSSAHFATART